MQNSPGSKVANNSEAIFDAENNHRPEDLVCGSESVHVPVLLQEVVEGLVSNRADDRSPKTDPWYLDGTLGGAGHALAIAKALQGQVNLIGLDRDRQAVERARSKLQGQVKRLIIECKSFRNLDQVLADHRIGGVDLILLDLGISSDELEDSNRGFSFQKDEPLLMTMGDPKDYDFTARDIVNDWEENVIADVVFGYGEERFARRIARAIVTYRTKKAIETSGELAEIVRSAIPFFKRQAGSFRGKSSGGRKIHPATKTFQALRIAVNDELNALRQGLGKSYEKLNLGGRLAVISFHSLEDRIVKDFYKKQAETGALILTKKPIGPSAQETAENPRSRSAKLRIISKPVNLSNP